jgi:alkylation response protein AidB-like acyl-CoA dehydrogenase
LSRTGEDGWLSILAPEALGGMGRGLVEASIVATAFGHELAPIPFAGAAPALLAAQALRDALGADALAETLAGKSLVLPVFNWGEARIEAKRDGDNWILEGIATGVYGAPAANTFIVETITQTEPSLAIVRGNAAGVSINASRTVDGATAGNISFVRCLVPEVAFISGDVALRLRHSINTAMAILCAAELVGVMGTALDRTLEHIKTRVQFGKSLGSFQALQFKAVDAYIGLALSRALVREAARLVDEGNISSGLMASTAKAKAAEAARELTRVMVQLHGAIGFADEHDVGLYLKRALALGAAWGTATNHRRDIAENNLSEAGENVRFREDAPDDISFRAEVRAWLEENLPTRLRHLPTRPSFEDAGWWHRKLAGRGWIAPTWPKAHGGMEASVAQQVVLFEELGSIGAPEISGQAINHLGPILQVFGTREQKARHLPGMLSGDVIWSQGYSEPGAGSDLASLRTKAVRDGGDFIVNGSKIWTTWGQHADWMFALVRTNPDVKKQAGITFVLIDMKTPGITRRPIRTIAGEDEFAEIFLDDVRVPVTNVVGAIDDGWRIANAVLEKERLNGANPRKCADILSKIKAAMAGAIVDAGFRDRLVRAEIDYVALCAVYAEIVHTTERGSKPTGDFAFAKLVNAELQQALCELLVDVHGARGALEEPVASSGIEIWPGLTYLQSRRTTIHGGTSEIQRGLLARRVLGLA